MRPCALSGADAHDESGERPQQKNTAAADYWRHLALGQAGRQADPAPYDAHRQGRGNGPGELLIYETRQPASCGATTLRTGLLRVEGRISDTETAELIATVACRDKGGYGVS